ncbi:MAG: AmfC protein [Frankiales bacterium]|nr:AmfC protein [Frankiales bacterium]
MSAEATPAPPSRGNRRIDRVLAEGFLDHLVSGPLEEIRGLKAEAEQEEVDLSYLRRLIQGRIDVLRAELARRDGANSDLVASLPQILADEPRSPARGLGRHTTVEPSRVDEKRRYVESLVADVDLSDVGARTREELEQALVTFRAEEQDLSVKRRDVQKVMDAASAEITRRYRDGEASVQALLPTD